MAYTPREIKDRVAVGDDIFIVEDLGDDRIRLIPAPTHVSEPGTPVNKALLQPMEDELGALSLRVDSLTTGKVDKVPGKGLSTNDFTDALKNKLDGIEAGAQVNTVTSVAGKTGAVTLSKSDVGLGSVQNYGIATQAQAEAGTANNVYMTPLRVKEAISSLVPVRSVAGKTGAVTLSKSDVGLGSVQNYGVATQAQAEAGTANNVYMTPLRVKEAISALGPMNVIGGNYVSIDDMFALAFNEPSASTSLTKVYESVLIGNIQGTIRVSFSLSLENSTGSQNVQGRVYRNGVAVGTLRSEIASGTSSTPTYTEDISGWKRGDRLQIYASLSTTDGARIGLHTLTVRVDFV